jgi:hypothetical protein
MFQPNYWKKSDEELQRLAEEYHIDTQSGIYNDSIYVFDRQKTIDGLLVKDNARRTTVTTILSIVAIVLSAIAVVVSVLK